MLSLLTTDLSLIVLISVHMYVEGVVNYVSRLVVAQWINAGEDILYMAGAPARFKSMQTQHASVPILLG